jgi:hypothetical protein
MSGMSNRGEDICLYCGFFDLVRRKYPDMPESAFHDIADTVAKIAASIYGAMNAEDQAVFLADIEKRAGEEDRQHLH